MFSGYITTTLSISFSTQEWNPPDKDFSSLCYSMSHRCLVGKQKLCFDIQTRSNPSTGTEAYEPMLHLMLVRKSDCLEVKSAASHQKMWLDSSSVWG